MKRGVLPGATTSKPGKFELADKGTLFLDEIGDVPPPIQVKLLRVLQEREFERLGGTRTIKVDVRLIAATNRDLRAALEEGTFREDLYYRLNVVPIDIPPLREHKEDIPDLANLFFLAHYAQGTQSKSLGSSRRRPCKAHGVSLAGQCARIGEYRQRGLRSGPGTLLESLPTFTSISPETQCRSGQTHAVARGQDARSVGRRNHSRSLPPGQRQ